MIFRLTAGTLFFIYRDMLHYAQIFDPKTDGKNDYILSSEQPVHKFNAEDRFTVSIFGFF